MIFYIIILTFISISLGIEVARLRFKVGYYEVKLKNRKSWFDWDENWDQIESVMNTNWPRIFPKSVER